MPESKGLVMSNAANNSQGKHIHNYSTFDKSLSYRLYNTLRFGDYTPSFVMEGVPSDEISVNSADRIDSLSLKAPFKGSIRKIKESFKVPNMAILPMQWDRIYAQNSNGDDVPQDANCVLMDYPQTVTKFWDDMFKVIRNQLIAWNADSSSVTKTEVAQFYTALMRVLVTGEYFFSAGSLLHTCGYKAGVQMWSYQFYDSYAVSKYASYDYWFDAVISLVFSKVYQFTLKDASTNRSFTYRGLDGSYQGGFRLSDFRAAIEAFRENPLLEFVADDLVFNDSYWADDYPSSTDWPSVADDLVAFLYGNSYSDYKPYGSFANTPTYLLPSDNSGELADDVTALNPTTLNLSRILAYQLVCAHFYTNSSVDFLYSAELYRQYLHQLFISAGGDWSFNSFAWNGTELEYDYLSGHVLNYLFFYALPGDGSGSVQLLAWTNGIADLGATGSLSYKSPLYRFAALSAVFAYNKSLRYGDYFTASRPRPLAPINTDVAVNSNAVSVVDITRNIQAQRFANAVMRSRSKIEEYVKSLFGRAPQPDYHNPFFLSREEEMIFGDEVQNTGDRQFDPDFANSRTANFAGNTGRYTFTFHNDDMHPCIYIQIVSFDIRRAYTRSVDRQFLHLDRFDMFNPDFQYIGDQPIYGVELGYPVGMTIPEVFAYTSRDMEYKQRFDVASGGFIENLPGWMLSDKDRSKNVVGYLDPDFIRSYNTELDQFFLSLTGYSLGSYFHFICITDNNVNAKRAMAVDPQILA